MWVWQKILSSFQCFNTKAAGCVQIKGLLLTTISSTTQSLENPKISRNSMSNPANDSLLLWKIKGNLNLKSSLFCTEF